MPCFDFLCAACGFTEERYLKLASYPDPKCGYCGEPMHRVPARFAMPFSGSISARYLDKSLEGGNAKDGSHWAWEKPGPDGKERAVRIETFQQQKEFAKRNGLFNPSSANSPTNVEINESGTKLSGAGLKGQWV